MHESTHNKQSNITPFMYISKSHTSYIVERTLVLFALVDQSLLKIQR